MRLLAATICFLSVGIPVGLVAAEGGIERVADVRVRIADMAGVEREPFGLGSDRAVVLVFVMRDCPIANGYAREIGRIFREYSARGVRGYLVYTDAEASREAIEKHAREYGHEGYPLVWDRGQVLVRAVGATRTPEAVVVGRKGEILYRGRIDNRHAALGRARPEATVRDLRVGLDEILAGRSVSAPRTTAVGCYIPELKESGGVKRPE